jgi:hypothetical protein
MLHNKELHNLYPSPNIIKQMKSRKMRWAGHAARMGEERKLYKVLVGQPEGKRPLGRPGVDTRIKVAQDSYRWRALVNMVMNLLVQSTLS